MRNRAQEVKTLRPNQPLKAYRASERLGAKQRVLEYASQAITRKAGLGGALGLQTQATDHAQPQAHHENDDVRWPQRKSLYRNVSLGGRGQFLRTVCLLPTPDAWLHLELAPGRQVNGEGRAAMRDRDLGFLQH